MFWLWTCVTVIEAPASGDIVTPIPRSPSSAIAPLTWKAAPALTLALKLEDCVGALIHCAGPAPAPTPDCPPYSTKPLMWVVSPFRAETANQGALASYENPFFYELAVFACWMERMGHSGYTRSAIYLLYLYKKPISLEFKRTKKSLTFLLNNSPLNAGNSFDEKIHYY